MNFNQTNNNQGDVNNIYPDLSRLGALVDEIRKENNIPDGVQCFVCIRCRKPVRYTEDGHPFCECMTKMESK